MEATKADYTAAATKADMESLGAATKADMELHRAATKADMRSLGQSVDNRFDRVDLKFEALEKSMVTLQDKIVIKLGALMVTMTFLLLALGPFYFRWVNSLMSSL